MTGLLERIVERRRASASTRLGPPQANGGASAQDAPASAQDAVGVHGLRERGQLRRRARYLRRLRELQLRDVGGFVLELHRFGRERPELLASKVAEAAETDRELRALERTLGERQPLREVREPGVGGACAACGTVHGSADRYCSLCGRPL